MSFEQAILLISLSLNLLLVGGVVFLTIAFINYHNKNERVIDLIDGKFVEYNKKFLEQDTKLKKFNALFSTLEMFSSFAMGAPQSPNVKAKTTTPKPPLTLFDGGKDKDPK